MQLLVISDSHSRAAVVDRIIRNRKEAKEIFFLGDVTSDIEDLKYEYTDRNFHIIAGNCDFFSSYPYYDIIDIADKKILFTHGHTFNVNTSTDRLLQFGENCGADIILYGHTHISEVTYKNGIYLINPGSCSKSRNGANSYAIIDIKPNGILPSIIKLI